MNNLKIKLTIVAMIFSVVSFAQHQHAPAKDLLKDKAMQDSIMTAIANDHEMMENMMSHIVQNKHAMHQIMHDEKMVQEITDGIVKDSSKCHKMMAKMMENKNSHEMMMDKEKMSGGNEIKKDSSANEHDHSNH